MYNAVEQTRILLLLLLLSARIPTINTIIISDYFSYCPSGLVGIYFNNMHNLLLLLLLYARK